MNLNVPEPELSVYYKPDSGVNSDTFQQKLNITGYHWITSLRKVFFILLRKIITLNIHDPPFLCKEGFRWPLRII